jgi:aminoglycoside 6'-N-acetyltransferase
LAVSDALELVGGPVRLRTTTAEDHVALVAIRLAPEVRRWWRGDDVGAELRGDLSDPDTHQLTIILVETGEIVGLIQFAEEHDPEYRHASIDVFVAPDRQRQGIATDAIVTLCDHLFDSRGHHRVVIDPAVDNHGAIACYERVGFRRVGVMRQYELRDDGSWGDGLLMELLSTDRSTG